MEGTEKPPPSCTNWPTVSLRTSTTMMMRPSAVICGVTSSRRTAFLNCTVAGEFAVPGVTYGISAAEVDERERGLAGSVRHRQVHVELRGVRVAGGGDAGGQLALTLINLG